VSHSKIRTEKICLNCGTDTPGRYCPSCGQENIEPKQSVWHLINHFFSDITHFDGKFFVTVKDLFAKPGFLSREYMVGRRASYLDPIRMYIFTSAFFFLIFFSLFNVKKMKISEESNQELLADSSFRALMSQAKTARDSLKILEKYKPWETPLVRISEDSANINPGLQIGMVKGYHSPADYDSIQKKLPADQRDGWFKRRLNIRMIEIAQQYHKDRGVLFRELINNFLHGFPKMLFISLPVFALLLKLLYFRRREFYYVDHGIFSIHLFIFSFLMLLVFFGLNELRSGTGWSWLGWLYAPVLIYPFVYYYKAMRRFYGQGRGKTLLKYILLSILSFFVQVFIFLTAALFTVLES
jgi:hypothetical protein